MKTKTSFFVASIASLLITVSANAQNWLTTGNKGLNTSSNFLGTIDTKALPFRTHNIERMRITLNGNVGIGTTSPQQRLDVRGSLNIDTSFYINQSKTLFFQNGELNFNGNGGGIHLGNGGETIDVGTYGQTSTSLGVQGGDNAITAYASVIGTYSVSDNPNPEYFSNAIYAVAKGGNGVLTTSDSSYGIYASTGNPSSYAGYFSGNVYSSGFFQSSDEKLKQNITDFSSAMDILKQLHPKQYQYKQDGDYKLMNLPNGQHYGLIAQDVEKILPDLVKNSKFNVEYAMPHKPFIDSKSAGNKFSNQTAQTAEIINFKALNYTELIPIIIKGMQEQQTTIEKQQQSIEELKQLNQQQQQQINQLIGLVNAATANSIATSKLALQQNVPNPFSNSTSITYSLPAKFSSAKIIITDKNGNALKQINLTNTGNGTVQIDASTLASGAYQYSLYIDGKTIETKQMVLQK